MKLNKEQREFTEAALNFYINKVIHHLPASKEKEHYKKLWGQVWEAVGQ